MSEVNTIQAYLDDARDSVRKARSLADRGSQYKSARDSVRAVLKRIEDLCDDAMRDTNEERRQEIRDADGTQPAENFPAGACKACGGNGRYWVRGDFYENGYWQKCLGTAEHPHAVVARPYPPDIPAHSAPVDGE